MRLSRMLSSSLLGVACTCALAGPAQAAGLLGGASNTLGAATGAVSGVANGLLNTCQTGPLTQPFAQFGDLMSYEQVPGGTFEAGSQPWSLSGGAAAGGGNESYYVNSASDSQSLSLPDGSSATSPSLCVGLTEPDLRLFVRNTGSATATLQVTLNYTLQNGNSGSLQIADLTGGSSWAPTAPILLWVNLPTGLTGTTAQTSFQFTPVGQGGNWQIDDVYVDPNGRG
jgi:hypothetical protein